MDAEISGPSGLQHTPKYEKRPIPQANNCVWKRPATPRETTLGLRTDGRVRSICSHLEISSSTEIERDVLERCAEHFNRDMSCFQEFLMERAESKDIWVVKMKESTYVIEVLEDDDEIEIPIIEDEINCRLRSEDIPKWKLFRNYVGYDASGNDVSNKYPHLYQLIFVFSTGTIDEFSCALLCDLFLNILDCALKNVTFQCYSHLNMYNIGSKVDQRITALIGGYSRDEGCRKSAKKSYRKIAKLPRSNFDFKKRNFENKETLFKTKNCMFSKDCTRDLLEVCKTKNIGIYALFIVLINNVLMHHAKKKGFKGIFRARALHMINTRFILNIDDKKFSYKLGSYFLPYLQNFKLESTEIAEIFKEVPRVEEEMDRITSNDLFWEQEALKEISIHRSGSKYNSGKWNPHYCFSLTNLGDLDVFYSPESPQNSFQVLSYERASAPMEGGHLDVVFCIFRNKLVVHFDFSNEYFSDKEMITMIRLFSNFVENIS